MLYDSYSVSIHTATDFNTERAYALQDLLAERFPGIQTAVTEAPENPDALASVTGPETAIVSFIDSVCRDHLKAP